MGLILFCHCKVRKNVKCVRRKYRRISGSEKRMLEKSEKTAYRVASYFILAIYNIDVVPIKKYEIGGTCHMCGANEKCTQHFGL